MSTEIVPSGGRSTALAVEASALPVLVERRLSHAKYGKYMTSRTKYKAHDEKNEYKTGDRVLIVEARPLSRDKRWRVEKLVQRRLRVPRRRLDRRAVLGDETHLLTGRQQISNRIHGHPFVLDTWPPDPQTATTFVQPGGYIGDERSRA